MPSIHRRRGVRAVALTASAVLAVSLGANVPAYAGTASHTASSKSTSGATTGNLTEAQASARAVASGKAVAVTADTTATRTVTANPDGTFTETTSNEPVRAKVGGSWKNLDATLVRNADGTVSPKVADSSLKLSGGGHGPLAVMAHSATSLTLNLPTGISTLPTPALSADTATYANVLPGVDLQITATDLGGFSEVLVVHNAAAAANPALAPLSFPATGKGVTLATDAAGEITASDKTGHVLYNAPAATMWDSATNSAAVARAVTAKNNATGQVEKIDPDSGDPVYSSTASAGAGAHHASLKARYTDGRITLTPDSSLLHGSNVVYPVYIDPSYGSNNPEQSWTYIRDDYPGNSYWDTNDSENNTFGDLRVGYSQNDTTGVWFNAKSYFAMGIDEAVLHNATIQSSTLYTEEEWSYSCTASEVDLYQTDAISKSTTWNSAAAFRTKLGSKSIANEYGNSSCSPASYGWDVKSEMQSAVNANWGNITYGLETPSENNSSEWHRFNTKITQTTTYDRTPNTPTSLHTSPSTQCTTTNPDTIGLGSVTLYAGVSDPDGQSVYTYFKLWNTSTGAVIASTSALSQPSGTTASLSVDKSKFNTSGVTEYSWDIYITDGPASDSNRLTSGTSKTCDFYYDATTEGQPDVTVPASSQVGDPSSFSFAPGTCPSTCSTPSSYTYQLNGGTPINVDADTSGDATVSIKPTRQTNTLTVYATTSGGNEGQASNIIFNSTAAADATVQDLNGDSVPDMLTVGATDLAHRSIPNPTNKTQTETGYIPGSDTGASTPAGLWLSAGNGTSGQIATTATDIGVSGTGLTDTYGPEDFAGDQAVTGQFTDEGFQDVLTYNPATGTGEVIDGSGDGSALVTAESGNVHNIDAINLEDATNSDAPLELANAYQSVLATSYDDLVGISGDDKSGYSLEYYETGDRTTAYTAGLQLTTDSTGATPIAPPTSTASPNTWNTWEISSTEINGSLNLILWQPSTGLLYDWAGFTATDDDDFITASATYTSEELSASFHTNGDLVNLEPTATPSGKLMVWAVTSTGAVSTDVFTNLSPTSVATDTTEAGQNLTTSTHDWPLNDYGTNGSTAADLNTGTSLNLTGTSGVSAYTGDELFNPDVEFNGTSGNLSTSAALDLTNSFTVSLWAKPTSYGRVALSQDGTSSTAYPGIMIYPTTSGWEFYLAKDNGAASWDGDAITGGTAQLGSWAHIQASYNKATKVMSLYVDDTFVATGNHTAPSTGATGNLRLGSNIDDGTQVNYYAGQLADAQTWNGVALAPNQPYTAAAYHQAITPERILASTPIAANSTLTVPVVGDAVTPITSGAPTAIPASATAVAIDITLTGETTGGALSAYPDSSQQPITSAVNYTANTNTTGYQIVPIGPDGKITLYNSGGAAKAIVDATGYFTTDPTHALTGDQTYHTLTTASRVLDTRYGTGAPQAQIGAGKSLTLNVTNTGAIPSGAAAVAINLTAVNQTGSGYVEAYPAGTTTPSNTDTSLTYSSTATATLSADVSLGTGSNANEITITNLGTASTDFVADVQGYYTNDTSGQVYHTVNPTRLVDTRYGIGGKTGAIAAAGIYQLSDTGQDDAGQITSATTPTFALQLTVTQPTDGGALNAYPDPTRPTTSNLNWVTGQTIANLALVKPGTDNIIDFYNDNSGTIQLVIDTSGYYANS